jgi:hypothetical protein
MDIEPLFRCPDILTMHLEDTNVINVIEQSEGGINQRVDSSLLRKGLLRASFENESTSKTEEFPTPFTVSFPVSSSLKNMKGLLPYARHACLSMCWLQECDDLPLKI